MINTKVEHHHYINNCVGHFYRGILNYFADELYPFKYKVIGTYSKAVEFFNKRVKLHQETDEHILPAITLDPSGDFLPEEQGGRFLWEYPNLYPSFGAKLFDPIYRDDQINITPVFTRFAGSFDLIVWLQSVYEYIDFRTLVIMWSGGLNRIIKPKHFWSYIVLPDEVLNYEYVNEFSVGSPSYQIDWRNTPAVLTLIRNMNQERVVYPVILSPTMKITGLSDGSEKYGGSELGYHKLIISMDWEVNLPTFMVVGSDWKLEKVKMNFELGNVYSKYGSEAPIKTLNKLTRLPGTEYQNINSMQIFAIPPEVLDTATVIQHNNDWVSFPSSQDIIEWNPIVSGPFRFLQTPSDWDLVQPGDIVYSEYFSDQYIAQIRLAKGFITKRPDTYEYIKKTTELLRRPLISNINNSDLTILSSIQQGTIVTIDPYLKKIYLDQLQALPVDPETPGYGYQIVTGIGQSDPNSIQQVTPVSGVQSDGFIGIYDSTSFKWETDIKYNERAVYEFSDYDLSLKSDEHVTFIIPIHINKSDEMILISYPGELRYGDHYDIDFTTQIVTLKIPAREGEMVEMYFYN